MAQSFPAEQWPAGHRAALLVIVRVVADDADQSIPALGLDYTTTGLQHILHTLADLGVSATTAWGERALATSPQLARLALEEGHDVIPASASDNARDLIARLSGAVPTGAMTSVDLDRAGNLAWLISDRGGDLPVVVGEGTLSIPTSPFWSDVAWFDPTRPSPPSALLEAWSQGLQSVRASNQLMTVILHPHLSGRLGFLEAIARFLDEAIGAGDVWIARGSDLAAWWLSRSQDTAEV